MPGYEQYYSHAKIIREVNAPVEITDIVVSQQKGMGEFNTPKSKYKNTDRVKRMGDHIEFLAKIANTEHEKNNFSGSPLVLMDDSKNKVTRLNLNEFSLYPKDTPLSVDEYKELLVRVNEIANNCHPNLHLMLASVPVRAPDNQVYNMVIHAQCGKDSIVNTFAKSVPSDIDAVYTDTYNPSFIGSGKPPNFIGRKTDTSFGDLSYQEISDKIYFDYEKGLNSSKQTKKQAALDMLVELVPLVKSKLQEINDPNYEVPQTLLDLSDQLETAVNAVSNFTAFDNLAPLVEKFSKAMDKYKENCDKKLKEFNKLTKNPKESFTMGNTDPEMTYDDFGKTKVTVESKTLKTMAKDAATRMDQLNTFVKGQPIRRRDFILSLNTEYGQRKNKNPTEAKQWLDQMMKEFEDKDNLLIQQKYHAIEGLFHDIEVNLLPGQTTLAQAITDLRAKLGTLKAIDNATTLKDDLTQFISDVKNPGKQEEMSEFQSDYLRTLHGIRSIITDESIIKKDVNPAFNVVFEKNSRLLAAGSFEKDMAKLISDYQTAYVKPLTELELKEQDKVELFAKNKAVAEQYRDLVTDQRARLDSFVKTHGLYDQKIEDLIKQLDTIIEKIDSNQAVEEGDISLFTDNKSVLDGVLQKVRDENKITEEDIRNVEEAKLKLDTVLDTAINKHTLSATNLSDFKTRVKDYQENQFNFQVETILTRFNTKWDTDNGKKEFKQETERLAKILTVMQDKLPLSTTEKSDIKNLIDKLAENKKIELNEILTLKTLMQTHANDIQSLPYNAFPVGTGLNFSTNSVILCKTEGGAESLTIGEVCLDHGYKIAKGNLMSTLRSESPKPLPSQGSHVLVSNSMPYDKDNVISEKLTHADIRAKKVGTSKTIMGVHEVSTGTEIQPISLSVESKGVTPTDTTLYNQTTIDISNPEEITIKNPPFGPNCVIRKYPGQSLSPLPLNNVVKSSSDTYTANYYVRKVEAIINSVVLPTKSEKQQKCIDNFKKELEKLKNDPNTTAQKFYDLLKDFNNEVALVSNGIVNNEDKEDTTALTRQIHQIEHYLDTKVLSPESYITNRILPDKVSGLTTVDAKTILEDLGKELVRIQKLPLKFDSKGKLMIPAADISKAVFAAKKEMLKVTNEEEQERLFQIANAIDKYLIKQDKTFDDELKALHDEYNVTHKDKITDHYYTERINENTTLQEGVSKNITNLKDTKKALKGKNDSEWFVPEENGKLWQKLKAEREQLRKEVKDARKDIIEAKTRIENIESELHSKKTEFTSKKEALDPDIESKRSALKEIKGKKELVESQLSDLQLKIQILGPELESMNHKLSEAKSLYESHILIQQQLEKEETGLQEKLSVAENQRNINKSNIESLQEEVDKINNKIKHNQNDIRLCKEEVNQSERAQQQLVNELRINGEKAKDVSNQISLMDDKRGGIEENIRVAKLELTRLELLPQTEKNATNNESGISNVPAQIEELKNKIKDYQEELITATEHRDALRKDLLGLENDQTRIQFELDKLKHEKDLLLSKEETLTIGHKELHTQHDLLSEKVDSMQSSQAILLSEISGMTNAIKDKEKEIFQSKENIEKESHTIVGLKDEVNLATNKMRDHKESLNNQQLYMKELLQKEAGLQSQVDSYDQQEKIVNRLESDINGLTQEKSKCELTASTKQSSLKGLSTKLETVDTQFQALDLELSPYKKSEKESHISRVQEGELELTRLKLEEEQIKPRLNK